MSHSKPILLTLPLLTPSIAVEILPLGLTVHRIYLQADGRTHDLLIGPDAPKDHTEPAYKGVNALIGRCTGGQRAADDTAVGGSLNEEDKDHSPVNFDTLTWDLIPTSSCSLFSKTEVHHLTSDQPSSEGSNSHAVFRLVSHANTDQCSGTLTVEALIALIAPKAQALTYRKAGEHNRDQEFGMGSILFMYRARLERNDGQEGPVLTPIDLSYHLGFNLDASLKQPDTLSIKSHKLAVHSDLVLKLDPASPREGPEPITDETRKHDGSKTLGDTWDEPGFEEYHHFPSGVDSDAVGETPLTASRISLAQFTESFDNLGPLLRKGLDPSYNSPVQLEGGKSGVKLLFSTNQRGVTLYTHNRADATKGGVKKIHGGGTGYGPGTAVFLDFCEPPSDTLEPGSGAMHSNELYEYYLRLDVRYREVECN